jgi:hypothetical protein
MDVSPEGSLLQRLWLLRTCCAGFSKNLPEGLPLPFSNDRERQPRGWSGRKGQE